MDRRLQFIMLPSLLYYLWHFSFSFSLLCISIKVFNHSITKWFIGKLIIMFRRKNRNILVNILWGWVVRFPTASGLGNLTRGWVTLKCTFALTSVDLSTPRSRRNVRGQVWLQTSLWPIWLKSTSARNIHEYISDIKAQFLPALDICRIVLCLGSPGSWPASRGVAILELDFWSSSPAA